MTFDALVFNTFLSITQVAGFRGREFRFLERVVVLHFYVTRVSSDAGSDSRSLTLLVNTQHADHRLRTTGSGNLTLALSLIIITTTPIYLRVCVCVGDWRKLS